MNRVHRSRPLFRVFLSLGIVTACSAAESVEPGSGNPKEKSTGSGGQANPPGTGGTAILATGGGLSLPSGSGASGAMGGGGDDGSEVCESTSSETSLLPVFLAFAFDVSGSMGKVEDSACFDAEFKWKPVVQATTAFFESPSATGLLASMVLFPGNDDVCEAESYQEPDVDMQLLPSTDFREVLAAYDAEVEDEGWRGNTPTLAAFQSTQRTLSAVRADDETAIAAAVLVTDGLPQGCGDDDEIEVILQAVNEAFDAGFATYVIGVKQPTDKPGCDRNDDNLGLLDNLNAIAQAGGTTEPFMIDTGDPHLTQAALDAAIQSIRARSVSCTLEIPPHPTGGSFDKDKTNVSRKDGGTSSALPYDPDCGPEGGWHYDDAETPTSIELCSDTCSRVSANPDAALEVDFLCEPRPDVIR